MKNALMFIITLAFNNIVIANSNICDYRPFDQNTKTLLECSYDQTPILLKSADGATLEKGYLCAFELGNGRIILATKRFIHDAILNTRVTSHSFNYYNSSESTLVFEKSEKTIRTNGSLSLSQKASMAVTPFSGGKFWSMKFDYNSTTAEATLWRKHYPKGMIAGSDKEESFVFDCR